MGATNVCRCVSRRRSRSTKVEESTGGQRVIMMTTSPDGEEDSLTTVNSRCQHVYSESDHYIIKEVQKEGMIGNIKVGKERNDGY